MPVAILYPSGAGDLAEWTASTGANDAAVRDQGGAFVFGLGTNVRDRYAMDDLPATATAVGSVMLFARIGAEDAGASAEIVIRLSGVDSAGAAFEPPAGSYDAVSATFTEAPGGLPWTVARVNALQAGATIVSSIDQVLLDHVYLAVDYTDSATVAPPEPWAEVAFPQTTPPECSFPGSAVVSFPGPATPEITFPGSAEVAFPDPSDAVIPITPKSS